MFWQISPFLLTYFPKIKLITNYVDSIKYIFIVVIEFLYSFIIKRHSKLQLVKKSNNSNFCTIFMNDSYNFRFPPFAGI